MWLVLLALQTSIVTPSPAPRFSEHEYRAHLDFLASDLCEGRAVGTRGGELAAAYIAAQFQAAGLEPLVLGAGSEPGWFQPVPLAGAQTDQASVSFAIAAGERTETFAQIAEVVVNSELADAEVEVAGELVFCGYGIEAPELEWNDYGELDVAGKVLVMLVNDPDHALTGFGGESLTYYGRWTYKEQIARAKGALGLILLHSDETAGYGFDVIRSSWTGERIDFQEPRGHALAFNAWLSKPAAERALALCGTSYAELKAAADTRGFTARPLGLTVSARLEQTQRTFSAPNVIGLVRGGARADEVVVYTAHYDHLGVGLPDALGDTIHNGAMDNASGTAALLCLARAFAAERDAGRPPERSVLFFANTGEESGLLGSTWYARHPPFPLARTVLVLNKDVCELLGERRAFKAFPAEYSDAVETLKAIGAGLELEYAPAGVDATGSAFRSDHFPFAARGVVAMSVGLTGAYRTLREAEVERRKQAIGTTYHQPSDEVHPLWSYGGAMQELELLWRIGRHWADGAPAPTLAEETPYSSTRRLFVDED